MRNCRTGQLRTTPVRLIAHLHRNHAGFHFCLDFGDAEAVATAGLGFSALGFLASRLLLFWPLAIGILLTE
jgi:hypothetical protein